MYCIKITNIPAETESVFFKMFSSVCSYEDVVDVVHSLGYLVTDGVVIKQTSSTSWEITQKSIVITKGWLFGHSSTEVVKRLFSFDVIPIIIDNNIVQSTRDSRSKSTQTKPIKKTCYSESSNSTQFVSTSEVSSSTSTYDEVIDELKLKLQQPNFGLQPSV